jgi:hypothetical protein
MKTKNYNPIFLEAEMSFHNLKLYNEYVTNSLKRSIKDSRAHFERLESIYQNKQQQFDKEYWQKYLEIYENIYPNIFDYSFLISACSLFEYQAQKVCTLIEEEHKTLINWDDMEGNAFLKTKRFLVFAGIILKDEAPGSLPSWLFINGPNNKRPTLKELLHNVEYYFLVRNCLVHQNGNINKLRKSETIRNFAIDKGILQGNSESQEIAFNEDFKVEVCNNMGLYFAKLSRAYYSLPLPE